jgi:hypothetical protein
MTHDEAIESLRREGAADKDLSDQLAEAYRRLGIRNGLTVRLPGDGCSTRRVRDRLRLIELRRPWIGLVIRDGHPMGVSLLIAGDTREDVLRDIQPCRLGPNGPIDTVEWLRAPEVS